MTESLVNKKNIEPDRIKCVADRKFAEILRKRGWEYIYQPKVMLSTGIYHPDFYVPNQDTYFEVSGSRQALDQSKHKIKVFRQQFPEKKLSLVNSNGESLDFIPDDKHIEAVLTKIKKKISVEKTYNYMHSLNIKKLRKKMGLSQQQFHKCLREGKNHYCGDSRLPTISNWELGKKHPSKGFRIIMLKLWKEEFGTTKNLLKLNPIPPKEYMYHD